MAYKFLAVEQKVFLFVNLTKQVHKVITFVLRKKQLLRVLKLRVHALFHSMQARQAICRASEKRRDHSCACRLEQATKIEMTAC